MENSSNQAKVLIWPSKQRDQRSVDKYGHVELLVLDKCYGFFPDREKRPGPRDLLRGCKGILLSRPLVEVAYSYLDQVRLEHGDDTILDRGKHANLPIVYVFTFKASKGSIQRLVSFLESRMKETPLYAIRSNQVNSRNCQTISREALQSAGIFEESSFKDVSPDSLLDLLLQKKIEVTKWQLRPPSWA